MELTPPTPLKSRDQRRSRRLKATLPVELQTRTGSRRLHSLDVARHGLFVAMDDPPVERHVVSLVIGLPTGPIRATAYISRRIIDGGAPGMGLQFFAMGADAKERWDQLISALEGQASTEPGPTLPQAPVYLVRLRDLERLKNFYFKEVCTGGMTLFTPVLRDVGSEVALTVIHPTSAQEYVLYAVVGAVQRLPPKRMDLRFHRLGPADHAAFTSFIETGTGYRPLVEPLVPPDGEPVIGTISLPPAAPEEEPPLVVGEEMPPPPLSPDDTFELDLRDVNVIEDARFSWEATQELEGLEIHVDPPIPDVEVQDSAHELEALLHALRRAQMLVRVRCNACGLPDASVAVGSLPGVLGLVVETRPYWCERCGTVVSGRRLVPAPERRKLLERLQERHSGVLQSPLALSSLFELADMAAPPRCTYCHGNLQITDNIRELERRIPSLEPGHACTVDGSRCDYCEAGSWVVERLTEPGNTSQLPAPVGTPPETDAPPPPGAMADASAEGPPHSDLESR